MRSMHCLSAYREYQIDINRPTYMCAVKNCSVRTAFVGYMPYFTNQAYSNSVQMLSWDDAAASRGICACLPDSSEQIDTAAMPYARPSKIGCTSQNSGLLLTPEQQSLDVLSTFSRCKYGHLDVIQNPVHICHIALLIDSELSSSHSPDASTTKSSVVCSVHL